MSFDSVAGEIVAKSIRSAICIDDEFVEPYKEKGPIQKENKPKQLTESFRKSNCSLDIHTYTSYRKLKKESEFLFKNRDLLVLDWELNDDPIKFKDALEILKDAAENPSLAFVLIYTKQPDLADIEMQIRSFFNQKVKNRAEGDSRYNQLLSHLNKRFFSSEDYDSVPDDAELFFEDKKIKNAFKELVSGAPSERAIKEFITEIREYFPNQQTGAEFIKIFEKFVKESYKCSGLYEGCEQIEFRNRSTYISEKEHPSLLYCHKIHDQDNALWINNTYITIFPKEISPNLVYEQFSKQLCSKPGNIMSLISMEMKNNFRENLGKVGKDLLAVDELAFFHHRNNLPDEEEFYDFLRNIWKHQVASFHLGSGSKVFPVLDEYIKNKQIKKKLDKILNGYKKEDFQNELAKLNSHYSFHHLKRKENDYIRFGDIFSIRESARSHKIKGYLLNITAQCDCLRPEKINNNFHFVSGVEAMLNSALGKVGKENSLLSFLFRNNKSLCISWETKPFTIFLPEEKRFFSSNKPIEVKIEEGTKYLFYIGTLLENYTQRIANKSFAHAARVGVDLAKL